MQYAGKCIGRVFCGIISSRFLHYGVSHVSFNVI